MEERCIHRSLSQRCSQWSHSSGHHQTSAHLQWTH